MKCRFMVAAAVLSVAHGSCKKSGAPRDMTAEECREEARQFRGWVTTLSDEEGHAWPGLERPFDGELAVTSAGSAKLGTPLIVLRLTPDHVYVDGEPVSAGPLDPSSLEKVTAFLTRMKAAASKAYRRDPASEGGTGLAIHKSTPWSRVVATVPAIAEAGSPRFQLLFEGAPPERTLSEPPASSMAEEIAEAREDMARERAPRRPRLLTKAAAGCDQIIEAVASANEAPPSERMSRMTEGAADALEACGCKANIAALKEIYWYFLLPQTSGGGPVRGVRINAAETGAENATVVEAPADASWEQVHPRILELTRPDEAPALVLRVR